MKKLTSSSRLQKYSLASTAFLCTAAAAAGQIVYTDISPDQLVEDTDGSWGTFSDYFLDAEGDGSAEFRFVAEYTVTGSTGSGASYRRLNMYANSWAAVMGTQLAPPICTASIIGPSMTFNTLGKKITNYGHTWWSYGTDVSGTGSVSRGTGGAFGTTSYIGFHFDIGTNTHYGWVRFVVNGNSSMTLESFAYNATPGAPILAGQEPNSIVTSAIDISNSGTAADIQISFSGLGDETMISEYRIFVVPESDATTFNLTAAQAATDYKAVAPSGADIYTKNLVSSQLDANGNSIIQDADYRVFVLAVQPSVSDVLSVVSASFHLNTYVAEASMLNLDSALPFEISGTAADFTIGFETGALLDILEYRAMMVPWPSSLTIADAQTLPSDRYKSLTVPTAPGYLEFDLGGLLFDAQGDSIEHNKQYTVYILSVADPTSGAQDNFSTASNPKHVYWKAPVVSSPSLTDLTDTGQPSDFNVSFTGMENSPGILEYRAFIVPEGSGFSIGGALSKPPSRYMSFYLPGLGSPGDVKTYSSHLPDSLLDYWGDAILHNVNYDLVVLTLANPSIEFDYGRTWVSTRLTVGIDNVPTISVYNNYSNGDMSDIGANFTKAADESNISAYRAFVIPEGSASVDIHHLVALGPDSYKEIPATGAADYTLDFYAGIKDVFGNTVISFHPYKVILMSVFDGPAVEASNFRFAPGNFTLINPLPAMPAMSVNEVGDQGNGSDVSLTFIQPDETDVEGYRVFAVRQDLPGSDFGAAEAVPNGMWAVDLPPFGDVEGSSHSFSLTANGRSIDGRQIGNGIPYKFYLLRHGGGYSLTEASVETWLSDDAMQAVPDRISMNSLSQQFFYFGEAVKADEVQEYKVFLRKADSPLNLLPSELDDLGVSSTIFPSMIVDGEGVASLQSAFKDIDGNLTELGEEYEVLILTIGDGGPSKSNGFTLVETGMYFHFRTDGAVGLEPAAIQELTATYTHGTLFIDLPADVGAFDLRLLNAAGQQVFASSGLTDKLQPLPDLPAGVYLVDMQAGGQRYVARFVKP